uniref:Uncharacterized protein n=1 Tax=Rhizophora mucronata TaxID=61149 RepID=A0A2P2LAJ2_RHIMU
MQTYMAFEINTILISPSRTHAIFKFNGFEENNNIRIPLL